jgi:hypothetical protein
MANQGQKGGAMRTAEQIVIRPLECVWRVSGDRLICAWIERTVAQAAGNCKQEEERDRSRRVA